MFAQIEPFGEEREDMRAAIVACTIARRMGDKRAQVSDFMIGELIEKDQQSNQQMAASFQAFAAKHNARLKSNGNHDR